MDPKVKQLREAIETYSKMKELYLEQYTVLMHLRDDLRAGKFTLTDMINHIYVMRAVSKYADDLRKECDGIMHMFENLACAMWVTANDGHPIRASLATGTPDINIGVNIPNQTREPERYRMLLDSLGIRPELIEDKLVKPYWPGLCAYVSRLATEGKPLPKGIDPSSTYPTYKVRIKSIQDLDELLVKINQVKTKTLKTAAGKEEAKVNDLLTTRPIKTKE